MPILRFVLAGLLAVSTAAVVCLSDAASSDVTPRRDPEKVWKDAHGRVIKRLDAWGFLTLFTRDNEGRIVNVTGLSGRHTSKSAEGAIQSDARWTHIFTYGPEGQLVEETDCTGERHTFDDKDSLKVSEVTGTAVLDHRHISPGEGSGGR